MRDFFSSIRRLCCGPACFVATAAVVQAGRADPTFSDALASFQRAQQTGFRWTSEEKFPYIVTSRVDTLKKPLTHLLGEAEQAFFTTGRFPAREFAWHSNHNVNSGGTTWVARQHSANGLQPPLLGAGEHFAILEGRDSGYYFYNPFDLWPHAQAAFDANWLAQDKDGDGLPDHDTHGDNTWDALEVTGPAPYSGALTLGALAAMADWSRLRGDTAQETRFARQRTLAGKSFERHFWNGRYYRSATTGERAEWILTDALFGILLAESAGLRDLLPREHVAAHLRAVAERNWRGFAGGGVGPSLFAPPTGDIPTGTQVGEVLVGSAHSCIALMRRAGLAPEADAMNDAMIGTLYQRSGLQFRTPAAWAPAGTYRSPTNLRPLASWYSLWPVR